MSCGDVGRVVVSVGTTFVSGGVTPPFGGRVTSEQAVTASVSPNASAKGKRDMRHTGLVIRLFHAKSGRDQAATACPRAFTAALALPPACAPLAPHPSG